MKIKKLARSLKMVAATNLSIIVITTFFVIASGGCATKTVRLENDPAFTSVATTTFVLKSSAYVFRFIGHNSPEVYIGCIESGISQFPQSIDPTLVGKTFRNFSILGILPKGTPFHVVGLKRVVTVETEMTSFEIRFEGSAGTKWGVLDGLWITDDHTDFHHPQINPDLVEKASH